jgi:serine/threonine protein kinase
LAARYRIKGEIGRGAMGKVYLAYDALLERDIALKELVAPHYLSEEEKAEVRERFKREARAAAGLTHPHIVIVHDILTVEDRQFIVMEYLAGKTLRQILSERIFSPEEVLTLAPMMSDALSYAHDQGIIHRDIKPDNIFVLETGNIKVADFGIAKMLKVSDKAHTGVIMGTPNYIAPELVRGLAYDYRVDIFSLGVTLYELLTGKRPFDGENDYAIIFKIGSQEPALLNEARPDIPEGLVRIVHHALQKNPEARYRDMKALREDLMNARADIGMSPVSKSRPFDKDVALQSELERAKELDAQGQENGDNGTESDFQRDREWKELISQIYHKAPDSHDVALSAGSKSSWQELEAMARGERTAQRSRPPVARVQARPPQHGGYAASAGGTLAATVERPAMAVADKPIDPAGTMHWSILAISACLLVIVSMMLPWISGPLNNVRSLYGITLPEGMALTVLTVLILCADGMLLLGVGKAETWTRVMKDLAWLGLLMVVLFLGLRIFGGIGYERAPDLKAMDYLKGIGLGFWLAAAGSILLVVASLKVRKAAV